MAQATLVSAPSISGASLSVKTTEERRAEFVERIVKTSLKLDNRETDLAVDTVRLDNADADHEPACAGLVLMDEKAVAQTEKELNRLNAVLPAFDVGVSTEDMAFVAKHRKSILSIVRNAGHGKGRTEGIRKSIAALRAAK